MVVGQFRRPKQGQKGTLFSKLPGSWWPSGRNTARLATGLRGRFGATFQRPPRPVAAGGTPGPQERRGPGCSRPARAPRPPRHGGDGPPAPRASRKCTRVGGAGAGALPAVARAAASRSEGEWARGGGGGGDALPGRPPALARRPRGPRPGRPRAAVTQARAPAPLSGAEASAGYRASAGSLAPGDREGPFAGCLPTPPEPRRRGRRGAHFAGGKRRLREGRSRECERRTAAAWRPESARVPAGRGPQAGRRAGGEGLSPPPPAGCSSAGLGPAPRACACVPAGVPV